MKSRIEVINIDKVFSIELSPIVPVHVRTLTFSLTLFNFSQHVKLIDVERTLFKVRHLFNANGHRAALLNVIRNDIRISRKALQEKDAKNLVLAIVKDKMEKEEEQIRRVRELPLDIERY